MVRKDRIPDFDFWLSELPDRLLTYRATQIRLFIASCCERQQTNYLAFTEDTNWGDPTLLREAGEILWNVSDAPPESYLRAITKALGRATPDTEDFRSPLTPAALDAAASLREGLEFLTDPDPQHSITICSLIRDTIYQVLAPSTPTPSSFGEFLRLAELEIRELLQQESDLQVLAEANDLTPNFVAHFRRCAVADGKSNLGL